MVLHHFSLTKLSTEICFLIFFSLPEAWSNGVMCSIPQQVFMPLEHCCFSSWAQPKHSPGVSKSVTEPILGVEHLPGHPVQPLPQHLK